MYNARRYVNAWNYIIFPEQNVQYIEQNKQFVSKGKRTFLSEKFLSPDYTRKSTKIYDRRKTERFSIATLSTVRLFNLLESNFQAEWYMKFI